MPTANGTQNINDTNFGKKLIKGQYYKTFPWQRFPFLPWVRVWLELGLDGLFISWFLTIQTSEPEGLDLTFPATIYSSMTLCKLICFINKETSVSLSVKQSGSCAL